VSRYNIIWNMARRVPRGRVATYGQIAELCDMEGHARLVGYAMHALPRGTDVPWHRILSATGRISLPGPAGKRQRMMLEAEGIVFSPAGKIDLKKYRWDAATHPKA
jgi:methylated-DNA-protein-cysteine methyltransferase-like protein